MFEDPGISMAGYTIKTKVIGNRRISLATMLREERFSAQY
jgi:hypothetical protein